VTFWDTVSLRRALAEDPALVYLPDHLPLVQVWRASRDLNAAPFSSHSLVRQPVWVELSVDFKEFSS
jgi:hypothetical protein